MMKLRKTNTTLTFSFHTKPLEIACNLRYGVALNVHKEHVFAIKKRKSAEKNC